MTQIHEFVYIIYIIKSSVCLSDNSEIRVSAARTYKITIRISVGQSYNRTMEKNYRCPWLFGRVGWVRVRDSREIILKKTTTLGTKKSRPHPTPSI